MKPATSVIIASLFLLLPGVAAAAPVRTVDDRGDRVELARPAQRIVSLAPHLTEMLYALGAGDRLVGADMRSDYPPAALALPRIGAAGQLDLERILALQPDLVLAWDSGNPAAQVDSLARLGLRLFRSEPREPTDIIDTLLRLGTLVGREPAAQHLADTLRDRLESLRRSYGGRPPVRVFYEVWHEPMITFNGEHLVSRGLALCGGRNVFADLHGLAPQVSVEAVLAAAPELIVASGAGHERPSWLDDWRRWPELPAVRHGHLHALHPDLAYRHTPRFFDGLEQLCRWVEAARGSAGQEVVAPVESGGL